MKRKKKKQAQPLPVRGTLRKPERQQPKTAGYDAIPYAFFQRIRDLPPFSFRMIRDMLADPEIKLALAARSAPLQSVEWAYQDGVDANNQPKYVPGIQARKPEVASFILRQLKRIWAHHFKSIAASQVWGWSAGEVTYRLTQNKMVEIDRLLPRHAMDCKLRARGGVPCGINVDRVKGIGKVELDFPRAYFISHNVEEGQHYGISALLEAYSPWFDKWAEGGALGVRRLFMHKDAYGGMDMKYPFGATPVDGYDEPVPNRHIAEQIVSTLRAGGVTQMPSDKDPDGNAMWELTRATVPANPQHILQFPKDLDSEIDAGIGVPDDIIHNEGSGAWAGNRVRLAAFYAGLDIWQGEVVDCIDENQMQWLIMLNFGRAEDYQISWKPFALQAMEQQSNAGPGGQQPGQAGGTPGAPNPFGAAQGPAAQPAIPTNTLQRMSLDPVQAVGEGVVSASHLVKAAQHFLRLSTASAETDEHEFSCVLLQLPGDLSFDIRQLGDRIAQDDLAGDGREENPHITVKFGLHADDATELSRLVADAEPIAIQLGPCGVFTGPEHDVVRIDVIGEGIKELNAMIARSMQHTDTHPEFIPHITIAYVKPGLGQRYASDLNDLEGRVAVFDKVIFSNKRREHSPIELGGTVTRFGALRLSVAHAPAGGVTINGKDYKGGEFIPDATQDEVDKAAAQQSTRRDELDQGTKRAAQLKKHDEDFRLASQWHGLMTGRHDEVGKELSIDDAKHHLERLDAAPGDNPKARAVLEAIANPKAPEPTAAPAPMSAKLPGDVDDAIRGLEKKGKFDAKAADKIISGYGLDKDEAAAVRSRLPGAKAEQPKKSKVQSDYLGPDSVVDGSRKAGFTDNPAEIAEARAAGLHVQSAGNQFHVYSKTPGDAEELKSQLETHGYGKTLEQKLHLSKLAGYSDDQIAEFKTLMESKGHKAAESDKPGSYPPAPVKKPAKPFTYKNGSTQAFGEGGAPATAANAHQQAIDEGATPREAAKAAAQQQDAIDEYAFARQSKVGNAGEDLLGSARHKRNAWRGLENAEKDGTAETLVTRDMLLKNEPHGLMTHADEKPLLSLAMHYAMNQFPPKPYVGKREKMTPEKAAKNREQFLEAYRNVKAKAEEIAASKTDSDFGAGIKELRDYVSKEIDRFRVGPDGSRDHYNSTANALTHLHNSLFTSGRAKSGVAGNLNKFAQGLSTKYGVDIGDLTKAGTREEKHDFYAKMIEHAKDVIDGKSINQTLGIKGKGGPEQYNPASEYVRTASRDGGKNLSKITANPNTATDHLVSHFKMRGVQWGNSVTDDERQHHAARTVEALTDLSDILGLHPEDIALNGKLGLAIGARGRAGALAHYEPDTDVINLTRNSGVGSLAHEWGHAFDHSIGLETKTFGNAFMSEHGDEYYDRDKQMGVKRTNDPRYMAMKDLRKAWSDSGYRSRLRTELQAKVNAGTMTAKRASGYWSSGLEIFARTFERYAQRKLESAGRKNTYLAGIESKAYKQGGLWPTDDETDAMVPHFDALFAAYRQKKYGLPDAIKMSLAQRRAAFLRMAKDMLGHEHGAAGSGHGGQFVSTGEGKGDAKKKSITKETLAKMKIKGTTDERTTCDHCGKVNLRKTVVFESLDADGNGTGELCYIGSQCASKVSGRNETKIKNEAATADHKEKSQREYDDKYKPMRAAADKNQANMNYNKTNRQLEGSFFMSHPDGRVVRVQGDGTDHVWYENHGFEK